MATEWRKRKPSHNVCNAGTEGRRGFRGLADGRHPLA